MDIHVAWDVPGSPDVRDTYNEIVSTGRTYMYMYTCSISYGVLHIHVHSFSVSHRINEKGGGISIHSLDVLRLTLSYF